MTSHLFMKKSTVYLIPSPLYPGEVQSIPESVRTIAVGLKHYYVEQLRTARRVLKLYYSEVVIDAVDFVEMNHRVALDTRPFLEWLKAGEDIGIMSEAGLPAMADPGAQLVALAQQHGAVVKPLCGPGSIYLSLIASGFNGQQFEFLGYLPIDNNARSKILKQAEEKAQKNITQIFIETPYRNNQLLEQLIKTLHPDTMLCVAHSITSANESVRTLPLKAWKNQKTDLHKIPCIFLLGRLQ